jgi:ABC-type bacteriocin/lantibiotic exporter with double-glycine peptidase domain
LRKFFAPEVVQSSNLDCGPAALKCLLEGFGTHASYGRLREACQTGIDGTSIDAIEAVANQLGLEAEQIIVPVDHLLSGASKALPCVIVVRLPSGLTHFVVIWRRHGRMLQVMDPAVGRRWVSSCQFLREVYEHRQLVPASGWREYAISDDFQGALRERLAGLGVGASDIRRLCADAFGHESWRGVAALDAAARSVSALNAPGAARLVAKFFATPDLIPERFWTVRPSPADDDGDEQLFMRGAVLIRVRGKHAMPVGEPLLPELAAAMKEQPLRPARELLRGLRQSGALTAGIIFISLAIAAVGVLAEAILFRGLFDFSAQLHLAGQRMGAMAALLLFSTVLLVFEIPLFAGALRVGRHIENRFRIAFLSKIPKLGDRYFHSRLSSDMAERNHVIYRLRNLPDQVRQALRAVFGLFATAAGIVWLAPAAAPLVLLTVAAALLPAFLTQPLLVERDLRVRTHLGALTRFYLDAMLGLLPIRAHAAEPSVRREHQRLLGDWALAALRLQRTVVAIEAVQLTAMFGLVAALLLIHPFQGAQIGRVLLVVYWALNLPVFGQDICALARQYPNHRNSTVRLLEPLGAPEESSAAGDAERVALTIAPPIELCDVSVTASGHQILAGINVRIESGAHVAIVGPSGAGKSSLVGILLGWLKPTQGRVLIAGQPLDCNSLRLQTAWVDPAVQLWNRSLLDNLRYGSDAEMGGVGGAIDAALLRGVLENLPRGMQTRLGEGGALVSGGEGQRVRFARAMLRKQVRLVILDEPFRGLDREKRRELLARARELWRDCTLLCITHDIAETLSFDRVLVVEQGRVVEQGNPEALGAVPQSRYAQLLTAEEETRTGLWADPAWRRIRIHSGRIVEELPDPVQASVPESEVA